METDKLMKNCTLCPRNCHANRMEGHPGICGESDTLRAARAALHMWEEPCISGTRGSGTVFFTGCVLHCVFCQNGALANDNFGKNISIERLEEIFFELKEKGANNINLVTPTHFALPISKALEKARTHGLSLPVVYNTGGYESVDTLKMLDGLVDVYLPDFKYYDSEISAKYSFAPDYFDVAAKALEEMVRQTKTSVFAGENDVCEEGMMKKGVIVRHLLLPGALKDSKKVVKYLYETYGDRIYLSLMNQYTPMPGIENRFPELARKVKKKDYDALVDYAIDLGVANGFIQEGSTADESFIPQFDTEGI